ncbi:MAG: SsrA RNA (tmRNA)-binding protein, SsrA-binding protein [Candidatus Moranbacteria bacterium GW2011_GWC1_45_18]|nr:MAG: SsrA-binding protein [Candidatus Moranbacteria bacterium GW2011_GWC2_40_12]KKT31323.1 MAG: SsrA-binding protein [Candidatus Moranbacteria bacterium GW2011_GWF2_44_10]KKT99537.1 MAG: SsrA RNA (tmRNA)-binding protein, SsrA-binding protein [Candidatus Moranbacteria bacterium GW2011_GWC1_45_18]OGI36993.1 MAG: SsrA-binding protein [Candidatus Moranbacteria bacterium RIFOXYC1_FULL_44_8]OGI39680.1 MAG: SsrA-binding protein [Candidatus Moranbacteria bacterium RIFOXYB1_FULL_44_23]OGI43346.1 MAG
MSVLAVNKRANFDYAISERFEAGLVLRGYEVKSVKNGHISLKGSFVTVKGEELYLTNANIPLYKHAGAIANYDPTAPRKLLLHRAEIRTLIGKSRVEGLTLVPIRVYTKRGLLKIEFGIGKGRKKHDKRSVIQKRESDRKIARALKR